VSVDNPTGRRIHRAAHAGGLKKTWPEGGRSRGRDQTGRAQEFFDLHERGAIDDPAECAIGIVMSQQNHGLLEVRIVQIGRRQQESGCQWIVGHRRAPGRKPRILPR